MWGLTDVTYHGRYVDESSYVRRVGRRNLRNVSHKFQLFILRSVFPLVTTIFRELLYI